MPASIISSASQREVRYARQKVTEKGCPIGKKLKDGQIIRLKQLAPNGILQYDAMQNIEAT